MKFKHKLFIFSFIIFSTFQLSAQLDNNSGSKEKIKVKSITLNSSKTVKKPTSLTKTDTGFKDAYKKEKIKKQQAEKDFENKGIISKELARKIKFQKFIEKNTLQIPMIDKDIGVFRTKSKFIYLNAFDFGKIDGDKISVFKNGKTFVNTFTMFNQSKTKTIAIPLDKGFNLIEILAVDEGSMRPNTGAFTLFDNEKKEVFSDTWGLAKGAKVIAHIIRE